MFENIRLERQDRIVTLTLNRPDRRNALSDPLLRDLTSRSPTFATTRSPASSS